MSSLQDSYSTGYDNFSNFYSSTWLAQTFTPSSNYVCDSIKLYLYLNWGTPSDVTVSLRATDENGKPTGADLVSTTIDCSELGYLAEWKEAIFSSPYNLVSGTKYAIVVRHLSVDGIIEWLGDFSSPTYTGGTWCRSTDSGSIWAKNSGQDFYFQTYGTDFLDFSANESSFVTYRRLVAAGNNTIYYEDI
jgi:hypothetical protein